MLPPGPARPMRPPPPQDNVTGTAPLTKIEGYARSSIKTAIAWTFILLSLGLIGLVFFWKRAWYTKCTHSRTPLGQASRVIVTDAYGARFVEDVHVTTETNYVTDDVGCAVPSVSSVTSRLERPVGGGRYEPAVELRVFRNKRDTYVYDPLAHIFYPLTIFETDIPLRDLERVEREGRYVTGRERTLRLSLFGPNELTIPVPGFFTIMVEEVLTPFYAFQAFSVTLWYNDDYWFYATCILIISLLTLIKTTRDIKRDRETLSRKLSPVLEEEAHGLGNSNKNRKKSSVISKRSSTLSTFPLTPGMVQVYISRNSEAYAEILTKDVVPGDVIRIPPRLDPLRGYVLPCDAVLIHGSCIVDECMLTGESIPVTKSPITKSDHSKSPTSKDYNDPCLEKERHAKHILFNGTRILQTRVYGNDCVRAYVVSTGFQTTKGRMVLNFLYPKPNEFRFDQDSYKFVASLFALSLVGFLYSLVLKITQAVPVKQIVIRSLDLVAIVVPPALPAAMTVGMMFAQKRLKKYAVLCISPDHVNACGVIDVMCFDKTGTLTEEGLDIWGALPTTIETVDGEPDASLELGQDPRTGETLGGAGDCRRSTTPPGARTDLVSGMNIDGINVNNVLSSQWGSDDGSVATDVTTVTTNGSNHRGGGELRDSQLPPHRQQHSPPKNFREPPPDGFDCNGVLTFVSEKLESLDDLRFDSGTWLTSPPSSRATGEQDTDDDDDDCTVDTVHRFSICTALCHSLTLINDIMVGDPLEIKMFQFSGWTMTDPNVFPASAPSVTANFLKDSLYEPTTPDATVPPTDYKCDMLLSGIFMPPLPPQPLALEFDDVAQGRRDTPPLHKRMFGEEAAAEYGVIHQYPFSPALQRMSVIARRLSGRHFELFSKGAPEVMQTLCRQSTLPSDYYQTLNSLADQGFRVIACAAKTLIGFKLTGIKKEARTEVEKDLNFLGFLVFQNKLKAKSGETLDVLRAANIRSVMVTGDNILTALSVAKESRLIPEYVTEACLVEAAPDPTDNTVLKLTFNTKKLIDPPFAHIDEDDHSVTKDDNRTQGEGNHSNPNPPPYIEGLKFRNAISRYFASLFTSTKGNKVPPPLRSLFCPRAGPQSLPPPPCTHPLQFVDQTCLDFHTLYNGNGEQFNVTPQTIFAMTGQTFEAIDTFRQRRDTVLLLESKEGQEEVHVRKDSNGGSDRRHSTADRHVEPMADIPLFGPLGLDNSKVCGDKLCESKPGYTVIAMPSNEIDSDDLVATTPPLQLLLDYLLTHQCLVFARMTPDHKTRLISAFQSLDYFVGMCGDGANDCGALKSAHMGISLATPDPAQSSPADNDDDDTNKGNKVKATSKQNLTMGTGSCEASLAAPFTAYCGDISCVPHVIREGRASLVTSFGVFKGMACYSLNQFFAVIALYWLTTNFSDTQFAYVDFFAATILTMLVGYTRAYPRLEGGLKPDSSLAGASHIGSVIGHVTINFAFLMIAFSWTRSQPWVTVYDPSWDRKNQYYPEVVTAVFVLTTFQYISFPVIFSRGPPFRQSFTTNLPFLLTCLSLVAVSIYFALGIPYWAALAKFFKFRYPPNVWPSLFYLSLVLGNFMVATFFETVILGHWLAPLLRQRDLFLRKSVPRHQEFAKVKLSAAFAGYGHTVSKPTTPTFQGNGRTNSSTNTAKDCIKNLEKSKGRVVCRGSTTIGVENPAFRASLASPTNPVDPPDYYTLVRDRRLAQLLQGMGQKTKL